jgi:2-amino-4-hydroxy-6-hydroxymethyldihydropteridine diphosphokinase
MTPSTIYLALGSNLGDRSALLAQGLAALEACGIESIECSSIYETDAVAEKPQPPYLNLVARGETTLAPRALLELCLEVERTLGRTRPHGDAKEPRTLDVDILLYADQVIAEPGLVIPHAALLARPFVRIPLAEVAAPNLRHPVTGDRLDHADPNPTVRQLLLGD